MQHCITLHENFHSRSSSDIQNTANKQKHSNGDGHGGKGLHVMEVQKKEQPYIEKRGHEYENTECREICCQHYIIISVTGSQLHHHLHHQHQQWQHREEKQKKTQGEKKVECYFGICSIPFRSRHTLDSMEDMTTAS